MLVVVDVAHVTLLTVDRIEYKCKILGVRFLCSDTNVTVREVLRVYRGKLLVEQVIRMLLDKEFDIGLNFELLQCRLTDVQDLLFL